MPFANKEKERLWRITWRKNHRSQENARHSKWKKNHPEYNREWAKTHKKSLADSLRRYRRKLRLNILTHYSNGKPKCECCGEQVYEFLTIDHINGCGRKDRSQTGLGGDNFYRWLKKHHYPEGFRILCMNCNFSMGIYGYCPHQKINSVP